MSIRRKLTLIILVTGVTALGVPATAFLAQQFIAFPKAALRELTTVGEITAANSTAALGLGDPARAKEILAALAAEPHIAAAALYDRNGRLFARYPETLNDAELPSAPGADGYRFERSSLTGFQPVSQERSGRVGTLYLRFAPGTVLSAGIGFSLEIAAAVLAFVILVAYLVSRWLQRQIAQPVAALAEAARAVTERQDYSIRAPQSGQDGLGGLADAFNRMLGQVQREISATSGSVVQLQTIVENLGEGVAVSDLQGQLLHFNRAAIELHGFSNLRETQLHLSKFAEIFELSAMDGTVLPLARWPLARVLAGEELRDLQVRIRRLAGNWDRIFSYRGTLVKIPGGEPIMAVVTIADITERKRAEEKIIQLNADLEARVAQRTSQLEAANQELEAFSYSVSHDLRAPLRHIDGFAGLLGKNADDKLDEKGRRYLATISSAAKQMGRLIDDLLAFSRAGRAEFRHSRVDSNALVAAVIREGGFDRADPMVDWRIAPLPQVEGDASMLRQVWANLIENAVKYSGKNDHPRIEIGSKPDTITGEVVFYIRDNGVGFDMKYVDKLFGVFQRLHTSAEFEGTGIGLANVRRIVARHGGRAWAEGSVGHGAAFYFSLPADGGARLRN
jgi:signal transduction histidine kinase